jgi:hypothetical protein
MKICVELFVDEAGAMNLRVIENGQESFTLPHAWSTTSIAWVDDHRLIYATSELYGDGGIYLFDFSSLGVREVVPEGRLNDLMLSWAKLVEVNSTTLTCWVAAVNGLDEGHLARTATKLSFKWKTQPVHRKPKDEE